MKIFHGVVPGLVGLVLISGAVMEPPGARLATSTRRADSARLDRHFGRVPLFFIQNRGQLDPQVEFYTPGGPESVFFGRDGVTIALRGPDRPASTLSGSSRAPAAFPTGSRWALKLDFVDVSPGVVITGEDRTGASISYFKGRPEGWVRGLPGFSSIVYHDLWPGIDLAYSGSPDLLKYEFVVRPGADASKIKLRVRGASRLGVTGDGQLEIATPLGAYRDRAPSARQERSGRRVAVPASFCVEDVPPGPAGSPDLVYGFALAEYDPALPLVIDPATIVSCGFLGGSADDSGAAVAVDGSGNVYVVGTTASLDFPAAAGFDTTFNGPAGGTDVFLAKVDPQGTGLVYCTYFGGAGNDVGSGVAVDPSGNAYVTGWTFSPDFPVFYGPGLTPQPNISEACDAFVTKVLADGVGLVYSGFVGGSGSDKALAIAVNDHEDAVITGSTDSSDLPQRFYRRQYTGGQDAFVSEIWRDGLGVTYSTYIGGLGTDIGTAIAIDHYANVYITGLTTSTPEDGFPVSGGPGLTYAGGQDAFVAHVQRSGYEILYCGYLGGSGADSGAGIAIDGSGSAYVTGATDPGVGFPVALGPRLTRSGGQEAFVAKVAPDGTGLVYSGFIGGAGDDRGTAIAVDAEGNAYVAGVTDSTSGFPLAGGPGLIPAGLTDAFVATVRRTGTDLLYGGYLGGSREDSAAGVAADGNGNVFVAGTTRSADLPVLAGPMLVPGDANGLTTDAFVARIFEDLPPKTPADLHGGVITTTTAEIVWSDPSSLAHGFKIEEKDGSGGTWSEVGETGAGTTTFLRSGLVESSEYHFRVLAWNDMGESAYSTELLVWTRPEAPSDLTASVINEREVDLSWVDHSNAESSFSIERKLNPADPWRGFGMTDPNVTTYRDLNVVEDTTYIYRVLATNMLGYSEPSNEVTVTTPSLTVPAAPTNLQATAPKASLVFLTWEDRAYNETGYQVDQKTGVDGSWTTVAQHAFPTHYEVGGLIEKTTYSFRVRAWNRVGSSAYSNEATVTTPAYQPALRLPLAGINFGYQDECSGWAGAVALHNDGPAVLVVNSVSFVSGSREFVYLGPEPPFMISPNGAAGIYVGFAPVGAEGLKSATFSIATNDPENPVATFEAEGLGSIPYITFELDVQRLTARLWMLRRDYTRVVLKISSSSPRGEINYRLLRRAGTGPYQTVKVFGWAATTNGNWTYIDAFLEPNTSYAYKIEAWDCRNVMIHESQEILVAAPLRAPGPREVGMRKVRKRQPA